MRQLQDLLNSDDPAWPLVQTWIAAAGDHDIEVLSANRAQSEATLLSLQITSHSAMGAIALETGGLLIDHRWLRILGFGNPAMTGTLLTWNGLAGSNEIAPLKDAFVVAHDAVGGFFAINSGAWSEGRPGDIFYLAPDSLEWENLHLSYSEFLHWACVGNLAQFYETVRWPTWGVDTAELDGDRGWLIWPPMIAKDPPLADRTRRPVPQKELWGFAMDTIRQIRDLPPGAVVRFHFDNFR